MSASSLELWVWGRHVVEEALSGPHTRVHEIWTAGSGDGFNRAGKISTKIVSRETLSKKLDTDKHQGIAARVTVNVWDRVEDWLEERKSKGPLTVLGMDEIQDPQNLGGLIRTTHFFGGEAVLFTRDRCAPLTGVVVKASAGAVFHLGIIRATNLAQELDRCANLGFIRVGLDAKAPDELHSLDLTDQQVILMVGSEGEGLRQLTRKKCDHLACLSGGGNRDSLNVSVAGGIALYELFRMRDSKNTKS